MISPVTTTFPSKYPAVAPFAYKPGPWPRLSECTPGPVLPALSLQPPTPACSVEFVCPCTPSPTSEVPKTPAGLKLPSRMPVLLKPATPACWFEFVSPCTASPPFAVANTPAPVAVFVADTAGLASLESPLNADMEPSLMASLTLTYWIVALDVSRQPRYV